VPLVAAVAPAAVPAFAAVDRLRNFASSGIAAVANAFSGWIYEDGNVVRSRQLTAGVVVMIAGLGAAGCIVLLGEVAEEQLFSGVANVTRANLVLQALAVCLIALGNTLTNHFLVPARNFRSVAQAATAGSLLGVPLILLLAKHFGASGGAAGLLAAEGAVVVVLIRGMRGRARRDTGLTSSRALSQPNDRPGR
jgi:hypothetical protein